MIFHDAAVTLQELRTPQRGPPSNTKKSRLPISQARISRFGSTGQDTTFCSTTFETPSSTYNSELQKHYPVRGFRTDHPAPTPKSTYSTDPTTQGFSGGHNTHLPVLANQGSPAPISTTANVSRWSRGEDNGKEPISSGFTTPSASYSQPPKTPEEIYLPDVEHWLPWSSSIPGSNGEEYLPSRGVPLALPASSPNTVEHHGANIEGWLNDIKTFINTGDNNPNIVQQQPTGTGFLAVGTVPGSPSATVNKPEKNRPQFATSKPTHALHKTLSASSDKENVSPVESIPSPTRPSVQYLANTASRFHNHNCNKIARPLGPTGALHFAHPQTPKGHLNVPSKRKKARVSLEAKPDPLKSGGDFTICDDQVADALAQLSPDVELRRKGRRPKRERCTSYWDEDILQPESPCSPMKVDENAVPVRDGRKILGESHLTLELTKVRPFVEGARDTAFDFQI